MGQLGEGGVARERVGQLGEGGAARRGWGS